LETIEFARSCIELLRNEVMRRKLSECALRFAEGWNRQCGLSLEKALCGELS
jgi:hypothetical protein